MGECGWRRIWRNWGVLGEGDEGPVCSQRCCTAMEMNSVCAAIERELGMIIRAGHRVPSVQNFGSRDRRVAPLLSKGAFTSFCCNLLRIT